MTLENLVGNTLERIEPDPTAICRLLDAASSPGLAVSQRTSIKRNTT